MTSSASARTWAIGSGPYGPCSGVADVQDGFVGQLVEHRAGDGEPADAAVEDADGRVRHAVRVRRAPPQDRACRRTGRRGVAQITPADAG